MRECAPLNIAVILLLVGIVGPSEWHILPDHIRQHVAIRECQDVFAVVQRSHGPSHFGCRLGDRRFSCTYLQYLVYIKSKASIISGPGTPTSAALRAMDARPARLSQHMSETLEDWYPSPIVHDCSAIAAQMEWNELLAAREAGDQIEPERLHTALKGGIPSELRSRAWLSFSGAAERMRRHPQLYEGAISHTVSPICHTSILPIYHRMHFLRRALECSGESC